MKRQQTVFGWIYVLITQLCLGALVLGFWIWLGGYLAWIGFGSPGMKNVYHLGSMVMLWSFCIGIFTLVSAIIIGVVLKLIKRKYNGNL